MTDEQTIARVASVMADLTAQGVRHGLTVRQAYTAARSFMAERWPTVTAGLIPEMTDEWAHNIESARTAIDAIAVMAGRIDSSKTN